MTITSKNLNSRFDLFGILCDQYADILPFLPHTVFDFESLIDERTRHFRTADTGRENTMPGEFHPAQAELVRGTPGIWPIIPAFGGLHVSIVCASRVIKCNARALRSGGFLFCGNVRVPPSDVRGVN